MSSRNVSVSTLFLQFQGFLSIPASKQEKDQDKSLHVIGSGVGMSKTQVQIFIPNQTVKYLSQITGEKNKYKHT